jgi:type IV secretory pathway VirB4 component
MTKYELDLGYLHHDHYDKPLPEIYNIKTRFDHTYIIGKTGKGKSTLMENMALYDINFGSSVIFIDPSGLSCRKLYHKTKNKERITYISIESPKVINPIDKAGYTIDTLIQEFIQVLDVLITLTASNPESTVLMREIINMAMRSIIKPENKNIKYITELLMYKDERINLLNELQKVGKLDEYRYWKEFDEVEYRYSRNKEKQESAKRVAARLMEISTGEMTDFVIGPNEVDLNDIVENSKVILVDTSRMNHNSKIYLTNLLVYAVLSFSEYSNNKFLKEPKPLMVYVDEFSIVVSKLFEELLAKSRKSAVGFVLAHQNFSQIPDRILDTIIGNADTMIAFACGDNEAERFSKIFNTNPRELMDLDPYTAWIRLGKNNLKTELHEPILDFIPELPNGILSPKAVNPKSEYWFLADEKDCWISLI